MATEKQAKRRDDSYAKPKKKKKRTPEVASSKLERRRERLNQALEEIDLEAISRNVKPGEREYLDEFVWMFNRIGRLIRATEKRALKSGQSRDIYALSTLVSQQREIIADIRTLSDMGGQTEMLRTAVLQPMTSALAQNILDSYYQLRRLITETSNPKETQFALSKLDEIAKEQSKFLQLKYAESSTKLDRIMAGEEISSMEEAPAGKKKRKKKKG